MLVFLLLVLFFQQFFLFSWDYYSIGGKKLILEEEKVKFLYILKEIIVQILVKNLIIVLKKILQRNQDLKNLLKILRMNLIKLLVKKLDWIYLLLLRICKRIKKLVHNNELLKHCIFRIIYQNLFFEFFYVRISLTILFGIISLF